MSFNRNNLNIEWKDMSKTSNYFGNEKDFVSVSTKNSGRRVYVSSSVAGEYLTGKKYAQVGFDWEQKVMAIRPVEDYNPEVVKFFNGGSSDISKSKTISCLSLIRDIANISRQDKNTLVRYAVHWDNELKSLLVLLDEPLMEKDN